MNGGRIPNVLTIAGSDSSGGAGVQADLKVFAALGCYGASVITALTAQNTHGVERVYAPDPSVIRSQLDAVFGDIHFDAVKIGALVNAGIINEVARAIRLHNPASIVLDPVMVSKSGYSLLDADAVDTLRQELLPLATVVTPNLAEVAKLAAFGNGSLSEAITEEGMIEQGMLIMEKYGCQSVLIKGGHLRMDQESPDWLISPAMHTNAESKATVNRLRFASPRLEGSNSHGTGCALSSAIAAFLAHGFPLEQAIAKAKNYLDEAIKQGVRLEVGRGPIKPIHHLHPCW